ncbi:hypothetical protein LB505_009654 [Fusarium chuoi]|nr:hypothetical protein LB505_009654 [Fusarium chuoi]
MALDLQDGFVAANGVPDLEEPIFTIERVQLQFSVAADFVAAQVANNVIVLALSNGRILRIDLERPEDIDEAIRDWHDTAHVPRPYSFTSNCLHCAWRELLPPLPVKTSSATWASARSFDRECGMESFVTDSVDTRDIDWCIRWQHL